MGHDTCVTVAAEPPVVFDALLDGQRVITCLPGLAGTGDGPFRGDVRLRSPAGPTAWSLQARAVARDPAARSLSLHVRLTDGSGAAAAARVRVTVGPAPTGSLIEVRTEPDVETLAAAPHGWPQAVERLLRQFAANLEALLAGGAAEPDPGGDLLATRSAPAVPAPVPATPLAGLAAAARRWGPLLAAGLLGLAVGRLITRRRRVGLAP